MARSKVRYRTASLEPLGIQCFTQRTPLLCMNRGPPVVGLLHPIPVASVKSYFTTLTLHVYDVSLGTIIWMHQLCSTAHFNVQPITKLHHLPSYKPLRCQDISSMAGPGSNTLAVLVSCFPLGYTRQTYKLQHMHCFTNDCYSSQQVLFLNCMAITGRTYLQGVQC